MERYSSYKDSGISWIGDIPEHWEVRHLSQVSYEHYISNKEVHHQNLLSLSYGRIIRKDINTTEGLLPASFDTYQIVEEGNIVMRLTDLQNDHKSLRVGLVKEEGIVTSAYVCLGVYDSIFPSYLYNVLHSYDIKKLFYSMGGGLRQNLNWQGLKKLDIPLPPKDEQQAIVAYIEEKRQMIDAYVADKEKEIELLQELKQKTIADAVTKGLNPDAKMKDSKTSLFGQIPFHWEERKMKYCFSERSEKNHPEEPILCATQSQGVIPQSMYQNRVVVVNKGFEGLKFVKAGDFVISLRSFEGGIEYAYYQGIISAAYTILTPLNANNTDYFKFLFKSYPFIQVLQTCVTGIREGQNINYQMLGRNFLPLPPSDEQQAIVAYIEEKCEKIDKLASELQSEIDYLKEYKQRLIADCVTGQVNVQNEMI